MMRFFEKKYTLAECGEMGRAMIARLNVAWDAEIVELLRQRNEARREVLYLKEKLTELFSFLDAVKDRHPDKRDDFNHIVECAVSIRTSRLNAERNEARRLAEEWRDRAGEECYYCKHASRAGRVAFPWEGEGLNK